MNSMNGRFKAAHGSLLLSINLQKKHASEILVITKMLSTKTYLTSDSTLSKRKKNYIINKIYLLGDNA